jgi:hypothetical protein
MLLFSRVVTMAGNPRRTVPWAMEMTKYVNDHSDLDVTLWSADFGRPLGTFVWSSIVESRAAMLAATASLVADDGYFDLLDKGQDLFAHPGEDFLRELVHGAPSEPPPIGAVGNITTAIANVDRMVDAVGWSVEIAEHVLSVTGVPTSVLTSVFGQMGEIAWIGVLPDVAAAEAVGATMNADPGYLERLTATKDLFIPGSGHVSSVTRIA